VPEDAAALPLSGDSARPGDRVLSIGNRRDAEGLWVCTQGVVRSTCRTDEGYFWQGNKLARGATVLMMQSPILEGDSGGPVVNDRGELVGVASAVRWQTPGTSVAIDVGEVRAFLANARPRAEPREPPKDGPAVAERFPGPDVCAQMLRATAWLKLAQANSRPAGFVFDRKSRLMLTSAQAVGNLETVEVIFPVFRGGSVVAEYAHYRDRLAALRETAQAVRGTVLARDPDRNLAVVELASLPEGVGELKLAKEDPPPGERVHAVGHPASSEALWLYAAGAVRQVCKARLSSGDGPLSLAVLLQLPGGAGEGGGPVVNDAAEVIALLSGREGPQQMLGYGTAASEVKAFLTESRPKWSPRDAASYRARAALYARTRQYRRAEADLDEVITLSPEDAELSAARARVRRLRRDLGGALRDCEEALRKDAKSAAAHAEKAALMLARGDLNSASAGVREAVRLDEKSPTAWAVLAEISRVRGDRDGALTACDKALDLDPKLAAAYLTRGRVLMANNDPTRARVEFTRAAEFDPHSGAAFRLRAEAHARRGEWRPALADCEQALELTPRDPGTHLLRASVLSALGERERALADCVRGGLLLLRGGND
jgi:tetratricopeptide (TPR) repeat protein